MIGVPVRLFVAAARLVVGGQFASPSFVQRRLRVGFAEAGRLLLALEGAGIVGEPDEVGRRVVLVRPGGLSAALARFGVIEDEVPPSATAP